MADRVILHSDMNSFYASCECLYHPEFAGKPVAVGGDPESRHGIILAKNQEAKAYGVKTTEALWEAYTKCPDLIVVKPNYSLYQRFSKKARMIYYSYSDQVEPFASTKAGWTSPTAFIFIKQEKKSLQKSASGSRMNWASRYPLA